MGIFQCLSLKLISICCMWHYGASFKKALNYFNFLPICLEKIHEIRYSQAWSKSPSEVIRLKSVGASDFMCVFFIICCLVTNKNPQKQQFFKAVVTNGELETAIMKMDKFAVAFKWCLGWIFVAFALFLRAGPISLWCFKCFETMNNYAKQLF